MATRDRSVAEVSRSRTGRAAREGRAVRPCDPAFPGGAWPGRRDSAKRAGPPAFSPRRRPGRACALSVARERRRRMDAPPFFRRMDALRISPRPWMAASLPAHGCASLMSERSEPKYASEASTARGDTASRRPRHERRFSGGSVASRRRGLCQGGPRGRRACACQRRCARERPASVASVWGDRIARRGDRAGVS